jgi:hypothetical protein
MVLLFGLAIAVFVGLIVWTEMKNWCAGVAVGTAFLLSPIVTGWLCALRVDLIGIGLSMSGLYVFTANPQKWKLAVVLMVLALFCKHSLLAAPAACVLWLLLQRRWKQAAQACGFALALMLVIFALTQWWSGGNFAFALFGTHPDPVYWAKYWLGLRVLADYHPAIVLLALVGVGFALVSRRATPATLFVPMALLSAITIIKHGSNTNHLFEAVAALCIAAGIGWGELGRWADKRSATTAAFAAVPVLFIALVGYFYPFDMVGVTPRMCRDAYAFLRAQNTDRVLSENTGALLLTGKTVWLSNPFVYAQLAEHGGWSARDLNDKIRNHQFDVIILSTAVQSTIHADRWTPESRQLIFEGYRPAAYFNCPDATIAYVPKRPGEVVPPPFTPAEQARRNAGAISRTAATHQ